MPRYSNQTSEGADALSAVEELDSALNSARDRISDLEEEVHKWESKAEELESEIAEMGAEIEGLRAAYYEQQGGTIDNRGD
jgi:peptidoglycan hydrolase CwlO-like protein